MQQSAAGLRRWLPHLTIPRDLFERVGWTTAGHVTAQAVRLLSSLILTRLLAPELFGIMILLTSLRSGMEMFTDIGIGQNVVASRNAFDRDFISTAWTLQIIRGVFLAIAAIILLPSLSAFYDNAELDEILPFVSLFFIFTGFQSIALPLAVKALKTKTTAFYDVAVAVIGGAAIIGTVFLVPTIWGLLAGNLIAALIAATLSYTINPAIRHRLYLKLTYVHEIIGLGKWIFLMSIIYFLANNFDRLMLGKYISFAALGLYGLARSLGDVFSQLGSKIGSSIIFPSVAAAEVRGSALRAKLSGRRRQFLALTLVPVAGLIATSDFIIALLYDSRYQGAAALLPWVGLAVWFGTLSTLNENVMMGLREPAFIAAANGAKLAMLVIGLPFSVIHFDVIGAAMAAFAADFARYVTLAIAQYRQRVGFMLQDVTATVAMLVGVVVIRSIADFLGLTGSLPELLSTSLPLS